VISLSSNQDKAFLKDCHLVSKVFQIFQVVSATFPTHSQTFAFISGSFFQISVQVSINASVHLVTTFFHNQTHISSAHHSSIVHKASIFLHHLGLFCLYV
jgi:hypothetical protein